MAAVPVVDTERLTLRSFHDGDFETYARWLGDEQTSRYIGGKPLDRADAWRSLAAMCGHWHLRGYGMWAVVERASGALVGRVGLWNPEGWPGVEVGWLVGPEHRRKGYALEAARASVAWGFAKLEVPRILSVIHIENEPSIAVARALGEQWVENRDVRGFSCGIWAVTRPAS